MINMARTSPRITKAMPSRENKNPTAIPKSGNKTKIASKIAPSARSTTAPKKAAFSSGWLIGRPFIVISRGL